MIDLLQKIAGVISTLWDVLLHIVTTGPISVWSAIMGACLAIGLTQMVKSMWRPYVDPRSNAIIYRLIAFILGFTGVIAIDFAGDIADTQRSIFSIEKAIIVGAVSPLIWWLIVRLIGARWPDVRKYLSGDP